jgi:hypothetical protein
VPLITAVSRPLGGLPTYADRAISHRRPSLLYCVLAATGSPRRQDFWPVITSPLPDV